VCGYSYVAIGGSGRSCIGRAVVSSDQDPLPTVPVMDECGMHHGPILLLVPIPSIVPTSLT